MKINNKVEKGVFEMAKKIIILKSLDDLRFWGIKYDGFYKYFEVWANNITKFKSLKNAIKFLDKIIPEWKKYIVENNSSL